MIVLTGVQCSFTGTAKLAAKKDQAIQCNLLRSFTTSTPCTSDDEEEDDDHSYEVPDDDSSFSISDEDQDSETDTEDEYDI